MATVLDDLGVDACTTVPATWEIYTGLVAARGDRGRPRYLYLDGRLTTVSPGHLHESLSTRVSGLIHEVLVGLSIDYHPSGQVTLLRSRRSREGTEADASYYLTHIDRVVGKRTLVMGVDPPPDLVVEVVVSHDERDALAAYRRFGVREVWVCRASGLTFHVLGPNRRYTVSPTSAVLPILRSDELTPWVCRDDPPSELRILKLIRSWVASTLAPRLDADG